tara:strand:+ start:2351 stop:2527 length:177 start_codon:yes stop_codon:yes gene_type:complete
MSFDKNLLITCDYCKKSKFDAEEKDTESCNFIAEIAGWKSWKCGRKTLHLCHDCNEEE